jgi:carbon monoxide dehydrogenase subunit G
MDLEQSFNVPFADNLVWSAFKDTSGLIACLPGAELLSTQEDGKLDISMSIKLGPIAATFVGQGSIEFDDSRHRGKISGGGADRKSGSRVKGEAKFSLSEHTNDAGERLTTVNVIVDYAISGSLAQFSRSGIIKDVAQRLTQAFAENLKKRLQANVFAGKTEPVPSDLAGSEESTNLSSAAMTAEQNSINIVTDTTGTANNAYKSAASTSSPPLDLGNLFWLSLWARIKKFFGFKP